MKKVFICSPYRGDVEGNTKKARKYCKLAVEHGYIPFAPHLFFTQFLNDDMPDERTAGIKMGIEMLLSCDEVWVFGEETEGMKKEIQFAVEHGKKNFHFMPCSLYRNKKNSLTATNLEQILQKYFDCSQPFLPYKKIVGRWSDGEPVYAYCTIQGNNAYNKLISLLYDLQSIGVGLDANAVIEVLDSIVSGQEY